MLNHDAGDGDDDAGYCDDDVGDIDVVVVIVGADVDVILDVDVAVDQAEREPLQQVVCTVPIDEAPEQLL